MNRLAPSLIAVLALVLPAAASAEVMQETRTAPSPGGEVKAEFSYDKQSDFEYRDVRIKISRGGTVLLDALVPEPCDECSVAPQGFGDPENPALALRDLDGNGEPEALVDLYTGGAHCCSFTQIYSYVAAWNSYRRTKGAWYDYGYELVDLDKDGSPEFRAADFRFAAAFTAYAASGSPPRILRFMTGRLIDVTRAFPSVVKQNLKQYLKLYKKYRGDDELGDVRGWLAAYTADKFLLGQGKSAFDLVYAAYRRGELGALPGDTSPAGKRYISALRRSLRKWGYS
ncbi:MAG TPA: hypothetical protein VF712_18905 [Thermoleophilaceae bacterium]